MSGDAQQAAARRLQALARHVQPGGSELAASPAAAQYASATGQPSSYARVHGTVSRTEPLWCPATVEEGPLADVVYEKAAEGIARVRWPA